MISTNDLLSILPLLILSGWGMVLLLVDLVVPKERSALIGWLSMIGIVGALAAEAALWGLDLSGFGGMVRLDGMSAFIGSVGLLATLLTVWVSLNYIRDRGIERGEYYALLLFSTCGILLMAQAANLIVVFLGLELLSIPLYILAGFARPQAGVGRSGDQVLFARRVRHGLFGVWHRAGLWRNRHDGHRQAGRGGPDRSQRDFVARRRRTVDRRAGVQGGRRAVPHVDARCVRRCSHADHGVHVGRRKGRRFCRALARVPLGPARRPGGLDTGGGDPFRADDDPGQRRRAFADQPQANVGLFQHRTCRIHVDGCGVWKSIRVGSGDVLPAGLYVHQHWRVRGAGCARPARGRRSNLLTICRAWVASIPGWRWRWRCSCFR